MGEPLSWRCLSPNQLRRVGKERSSMANVPLSKDIDEFPAQKTTLQLTIMTTLGCFAAEQRMNAHYSNDPMRYGLVLLYFCDGDRSKCYFIACGFSDTA